MKRTLQILVMMCIIASTMSSCYVNTFNVGKGAQGSASVSKWNHYLIDGLAPISVSDPKALAGDVNDYTVTIQHSFVNGLLAVITFGIYTPTTTTVTK